MSILKREEFLTKLKAVEPAICKQGPVELFSCIVFRAGRLEAYDGIAGVSVESGLDFNFAVKSDLITAVDDAYEDISLEQKDGWLYLTSNKYEWESGSISCLGFPDFLKDSFTHFPVEQDLVSVLKIALISAKHKEDKYRGVVLHENFAYSWDGFRATRVELPCRLPATIYLPVEAVEYIVKQGNPTSFGFGNAVLVRWEQFDLKYYTKILNMPKGLPETIDSLCLTETSQVFTLPKKLAEVVARVGKNAGTPSKQKEVVISGEGNKLTVLAKSESRKVVEVLESETTYPTFKIAVDPTNLIQAMKLTDRVDLSSDSLLRFMGDNFVHTVSLFDLRD